MAMPLGPPPGLEELDGVSWWAAFCENRAAAAADRALTSVDAARDMTAVEKSTVSLGMIILLNTADLETMGGAYLAMEHSICRRLIPQVRDAVTWRVLVRTGPHMDTLRYTLFASWQFITWDGWAQFRKSATDLLEMHGIVFTGRRTQRRGTRSTPSRVHTI